MASGRVKPAVEVPPLACIQEDEEAAVEKSPFAGQLTHRQQAIVATTHCQSLVEATVTAVIYTVNLIAHILLIAEYYRAGWYGAGSLMACFYMLEAATHILFDYLNRGRLRYALLDLLQVRVLLEFFWYVRTWRRRRGQLWVNHRFRSALAFESFFLDAPALTTQAFVLLTTEGTPSPVQTLALVTTSVSALLRLLHYFHYIPVSPPTYAVMLAKAAASTALRALLVALLVDFLRGWAVPCIVASWLLGLGLYTAGLRLARRRGRDDPLMFWQCHAAFGNLIAMICLFVAFPFAPSHAVADWWLGYLVSEAKMQLENLIMGLAYIFGVYAGDQSLLFYSACFCAGSLVLFQAVSLLLLHRSVTHQLAVRGLYTNGRIVRLFAFVCRHLSERLASKVHTRDAADAAKLSLVPMVSNPTVTTTVVELAPHRHLSAGGDLPDS